MKHLQGTWNVTALETEGSAVPESMLGNSQIIVKGTQFTTVAMGASYGGTLSIDESVTPHRLDLLFKEGPHAGKKSLAIYTIDGDRWTICLGFAGNDRPKDFRTSAGSGHALETLVRGDNKQFGKPASASTEIGVVSPSATTAPSAYPEEMVRLGGEWESHAIVMNGDPLPAQYLKMGRRIATGNEIVVKMGPQVQLHVGFSVDPTTSPKSLNYFDHKHPENGITSLGIYELEGDTLKTCVAKKGAPRPTAFASTRGDGLTFSVWKRL